MGGPSLGGKVCYEIAQQLVAAGEEPALVVMWDTMAPGFPRTKSALGWIRDKVKQVRDEGIANSVARIANRALGRSAPRGYANYEPEELAQPYGASVKKVVEANQRASRSYDVKPYPGVITMFRAKQQPDWRGMDFSDLTNGWGRFAKRVDVEIVDSVHQFMFDEPAVLELAAKFKVCLHRAQQRQAMRASRVSTLGGKVSRLSNPPPPPSTLPRSE
jgi:thioesterase domain-containing protein